MPAALAGAYRAGAERAGASVRSLVLRGLVFARDVGTAQIAAQMQEPDLQRARAEILWAQHIVFLCPTWWGGMPALAMTWGWWPTRLCPVSGWRVDWPRS